MNIPALALGLTGLAVVCFLVWRAHYRKPKLAILRSDDQKPKLATMPRLVTLSGLGPNLKTAICRSISSNLATHGVGVATIGDKKDAALIKWVFDNDYIPKCDLEQAVHVGLCQVGRAMFEWCLAGHYPDHALSPEALGYAMTHDAVSQKEITMIKFDHGETPDVYIRYAEGLLEKVIAQLEAGTACFDLSDLKDFDHDFCCPDCH